jgi:hypothetical protein
MVVLLVSDLSSRQADQGWKFQSPMLLARDLCVLSRGPSASQVRIMNEPGTYLVIIRLRIRAEPRAMIRLRRKILHLPADDWLGTEWIPEEMGK